MKKIHEYIEQCIKTCESVEEFIEKIRPVRMRNEEKVKYVFRFCGWNKRKREEGIEVVKNMDLAGYYMFPAGRIFLEQFGGMKLKGDIRFDEKSNIYITDKTYDLTYISALEGLQIFKNELLIPIAWEENKVENIEVIWGESGKVYGWTEGYVGILALDIFTYFARSFSFDKTDSCWWEYERANYEDYDLFDKIEEEMKNGTYISYAQKRFEKNGGVPNPMVTDDAFTQFMLSISDT